MVPSEAARMHIDENPYSSPSASPQAGHHQRSIEWQLSVSKAMRLEPWAIGYHVAALAVMFLPALVATTPGLPTVFGIVLLVGFFLFMWVPSLVYHGWFAGLLFGRVWGVLLAPLASSGIVGLLALWMFDQRARRELQACGWRVSWFTVQRPPISR